MSLVCGNKLQIEFTDFFFNDHLLMQNNPVLHRCEITRRETKKIQRFKRFYFFVYIIWEINLGPYTC